MSAIANIAAREILDSRGQPTLEVEVTLCDGAFGRASLPSGGSKGHREATDLRDGLAHRWGGLGVSCAIEAIHKVVRPAIEGTDASDQVALDSGLLALDGTYRKHRLGSNTILGVSMAGARAASASARLPLYEYLGGPDSALLPLPMFNVLNGGAHADNNLDLEEFMIVPVAAATFGEALRWGAECHHALRLTLRRSGYLTTLGDEGGFAPDLRSDEEALELILEAIREAGFEPGRDVGLALDAAANAFFDGETYSLAHSTRKRLSSAELIEMWSDWVRQYPIWCIEDGMAEDDLRGWALLTRVLGPRVKLVGDDVFATDPDVISSAINDGIGNAVLVKLDQIGTVTEAREAIEEARCGRYATIVSHRSGETNDDFIADFAVATQAGAIKSGAPCRGERVAKYNQLLRIEEQLGNRARFAGARGLRG